MPTIVTKTVKPGGGGNFTTLQAWATAQAKNCVSADVIERAECYGGGNLGSVDFSASWTMDATRYAEIVAADGHAHSGLWDTNRAYIDGLSQGAIATNNAQAMRFVRGAGIQLAGGGTYAIVEGYRTSNVVGGMQLDRCLFKNNGNGGGAGYAFLGIGVLNNCVVYDVSSANGAFVMYYGSQLNNCTAVGCAIGFKASTASTIVAKNCLAQSCTDGFSGTFNSASDYNISDIASDAPGANSKQGTIAFLNAAAKDYHLAAGDTVARGAGVNLTASGITTDIDGATRPATGAWDVGADQTGAAGGGPSRFGGLKPFNQDPFSSSRYA